MIHKKPYKMSKKKKGYINDIFMDVIEEVARMNNIPVDQAIELINRTFEGGKNIDEVINEQFYFYERPDYAAMGVKGELTWLAPLWNLTMRSDVQTVCAEVYEASKSVDANLRRKDLREYLYSLFNDYYPGVPPVKWRLFGVLWLMERYGLTDCLDVVLEVLRQDACFFTTYLAGVEPYLVAVLFQLGCNQTDVLEKYMYEKGLVPDGKPIVFDALVMTAISMPQKRLAVLSILSKYLKHCLIICKQGADPTNIDQYAFTLAAAHITELLPQLRTLFTQLYIPSQVFHGVKDIEKMMRDNKTLEYSGHNNLDAYLKEYYAESYPDEDEGDIDEDGLGYDDDFTDDHGLFDHEVSAHRMTITIELAGTSQPVKRTLKVPSNIYLCALSELIMIAFGRKDFPDVYEFVDSEGCRYASDDEDYVDTDEYFDIEDTFDSCLQNILRRKGAAASYDIKKGGKTLWHHIITVDKWGGHYKEEPEHYLQLEAMEGAYPTKGTKNMADYEKQLQSGKLKCPNFRTIRERIRDYEDEEALPF